MSTNRRSTVNRVLDAHRVATFEDYVAAGGFAGLAAAAELDPVDVIAIIIVVIRRFTIPAWVLLLAWFGLQLLSSAVMADDGVAYVAHAAGFVAGIVLAVPLFLRRGGPAFWSRTRGRPPHAPVDYAPSRIPRVRR